MLNAAVEVHTALASSQSASCLLHGDLHHDNIVLDRTRGWLAIDPKGVIGEPAYEFGAMLRNPGGDPTVFARPEIIARRAKIIADRIGLERHRIIGWSFAQSVLSAIWSLEDGENPARGLAYAGAVMGML